MSNGMFQDYDFGEWNRERERVLKDAPKNLNGLPGIETGGYSKGQVFGFEKAEFSPPEVKVEINQADLTKAVFEAARLAHQKVIEELRAAYHKPPEQFKGAARGILETADTRLNDLEGEITVKWKLQS